MIDVGPRHGVSKPQKNSRRRTLFQCISVLLQSPWQRGTNENTNRLSSEYFPKGTGLFGYSKTDLNQIVLKLNQRLRKTLGFETSAGMFNSVLQ